MNHLRLIVACAAIALSTTALACDDEDDIPPERASVVQVRAERAQGAARVHQGHHSAVHATKTQKLVKGHAGKQGEQGPTVARPQAPAPRA
jgi:hypothetical protein